MKAYLIERNIPGVGQMSDEEIANACAASNAALSQLAPRIQWQHSHVVGDQTFCIYLAEDEDAIREHAQLSGFPATKVTPINRRIDPTNANL